MYNQNTKLKRSSRMRIKIEQKYSEQNMYAYIPTAQIIHTISRTCFLTYCLQYLSDI